MPIRKFCSLCGMSKQKLNRQTMAMEDDVIRYGLFRQLRKDGKVVRQGGYGGIDLCTECWERVGKINKRDTRGKH